MASLSMTQIAWHEQLQKMIDQEGDGYLLWYDALRSRAEFLRDHDDQTALEAVAEVIFDHCLGDEGLPVMLMAVLCHWHGDDGDNAKFAHAMGVVHQNPKVPAALRAIAAEHISSCYSDGRRKEWGACARSMEGLGPHDAAHLHSRVILGEWDKQLITYDSEGVAREIETLIERGHRDAPARACAAEDVMREFYDGGDPGVVVRRRMTLLLQGLVDRSESDGHGFNHHHLGRVRKRLTELTSPEQSGEE
jgi:hypothetical protein